MPKLPPRTTPTREGPLKAFPTGFDFEFELILMLRVARFVCILYQDTQTLLGSLGGVAIRVRFLTRRWRLCASVPEIYEIDIPYIVVYIVYIGYNNCDFIIDAVFSGKLTSSFSSRMGKEYLQIRFRYGIRYDMAYICMVTSSYSNTWFPHMERDSSSATTNDRMDMEKRSAPAPPSRHGHSSNSELQVELRGTV